MADAREPESWAKFTAMQRSHQWKVIRAVSSTRACQACGDTLDSPIRYCPGSGTSPVSDMPLVVTARIPLESPTGQGTLFDDGTQR